MTANNYWDQIRREFPLTRAGLDFNSMVQASNPKVIGEAIDSQADSLDRLTFAHAKATNPVLQPKIFDKFHDYFGVPPPLATLTHSTTVGLAQIYGGVRLRPGHEMLASHNEHFCTLESMRLRARRDGTSYRQVPLYRDSAHVTVDEILGNLEMGLRPSTRVLGLTWVSSGDGVRLPISQIAELVKAENKRREPQDRLLLIVDGVHGFGVEDTTFEALGCDVFVAGCHKWAFGPRGTAIMCGKEGAWPEIVPIIPTFSPDHGPARAHLPGGLRAYEHFWALIETFEFLLRVGKTRIADRTHELATLLKTLLLKIPGIDLRTPLDPAYSSGIVCFDVGRIPAARIVDLLDQNSVRVTESGWDATAGRTHVRFSVSILNFPDEIERAVEILRDLVRQTLP